MRSTLLLVLLAGLVASFVVIQNDNIIECDMCKIAVKVIDEGADLGIDALVDLFIKACEDVIPGKIGQVECKKFADGELEKIIHALEHGTDPKDVCHDLHFCKKD